MLVGLGRNFDRSERDAGQDLSKKRPPVPCGIGGAGVGGSGLLLGLVRLQVLFRETTIAFADAEELVEVSDFSLGVIPQLVPRLGGQSAHAELVVELGQSVDLMRLEQQLATFGTQARHSLAAALIVCAFSGGIIALNLFDRPAVSPPNRTLKVGKLADTEDDHGDEDANSDHEPPRHPGVEQEPETGNAEGDEENAIERRKTHSILAHLAPAGSRELPAVNWAVRVEHTPPPSGELSHPVLQDLAGAAALVE